MDAFDSDVVILAASGDHPLGPPVRALFRAVEDGATAGCASVLLLPEVLTKPLRYGGGGLDALQALVSRLDLVPVDAAVAELATVLGATYGLRAAEAVHLASAVHVGADRFITNNTKDFPTSITEVDVTFPTMLPPP